MFKYISLELLTEAIILSAKAHSKQRDKGAVPYILHPIAVMNAVFPDEEAMIVALLHDVIEDTDVTMEEIEEKFSENISEALRLITRKPKEDPDRLPYQEYIENLAHNNIARRVKMADIKHNMNPDRIAKLPKCNGDIVNRYSRALKYLQEYEDYSNK